jgi:hypothetical protein
MMDGAAVPEAVLRAAGAREEYFTPKAPPRGKPYGNLRLLTLDDARNAPARQYLMPGLIAPGELSLWWGAPKCGKSFLLLRLAYGLARGLGMWQREPARPIRLLYVAAEGEGGFAGRLLALATELGDAGDHFRYFAQRVTVGPPGTDLADAIQAALDMRADLIVLDTLARTFGEGDENAARDMGGFVGAVDRMREATGAHVAVIHHATKEGGSSRGSGALVGAADLIVKVTSGASGEPSLATVEAAKDDADGAGLGFRLRVLDLPPGPDGTTRRTCVAEEAEATERRGKPLGRNAENAMRFLLDLMAKEASPLPAGPDYPQGLNGVLESHWRSECEDRRLSAAEKREDRLRVVRKAIADLRDAGRIGLRDGWVWPTREGQPR